MTLNGNHKNRKTASRMLLENTNYGEIVWGYYLSVIARWLYTEECNTPYQNIRNIENEIAFVRKSGYELFASTMIDSMLDRDVKDRQAMSSIFVLYENLISEENDGYIRSLHAKRNVRKLIHKIERLEKSEDWDIFKKQIRNPTVHWRYERYVSEEYNSSEVFEALNKVMSRLYKITNFISKRIFRKSKLPKDREYLETMTANKNPKIWCFTET